MTAFDYIVLAVILLSALLGLWRGVIREAFALAAWIAAVVCMFLLGDHLAIMLLAGLAKNIPWLRQLIGYALVFVGVFVALSIVGFLFTKFVQAIGLSFIDRALGMLFGVLRGSLIVVLVVLIAGATDWPKQPWWRDSLSAKPLAIAATIIRLRLPEDLAKVLKVAVLNCTQRIELCAA